MYRNSHLQHSSCGEVNQYLSVGIQCATVALVLGLGTMENLGYSNIGEIPPWINSEGRIATSKTIVTPGMGSAVTRSVTQREDPLSVDEFFPRHNTPGDSTQSFVLPFQMGERGRNGQTTGQNDLLHIARQTIEVTVNA